MKALLIADDEKAITNISEVLKSAGYDVIVYKWLLKAMDNLEEIKPHLIVVSTKDYPRHWKTLAQYSSNIKTDYRPEMILYSPEKLSDEELKKAETLRVRGIFDSCEVEGLDKLREILSKKPDIFSGYLTEPEQGEVTLKDLIPELDEKNLKTISEDIDSLKKELNKPFDINEAIAELEKAKTTQDSTRINTDSTDEKDGDFEDSENIGEITQSENQDELISDSTRMDTDSTDEKDGDFEDSENIGEITQSENQDELTQDSTQINAEEGFSQIEKNDEDSADEVEELKSENSDEVTQNENQDEDEIQEVKTESDEAKISENEQKGDFDKLNHHEDESQNDSNQDSTRMNTDSTDEKDGDFEDSENIGEISQSENQDELTQDSTRMNTDSTDEKDGDSVDSENIDEITQSENQDEIQEVKTESDEAKISENEQKGDLDKLNHHEDESQKNLEAEKESDIIEEDENQKSDDEISENESETDSQPKDEKMNEDDIEAKLAAIMNANKADAKEKAEEAGIDNYSCGFVFTNPITLALVTGTARNYNGMTLEFTPDIPNFIMNLAPDTQISDASLKVNGEISDVKAEVMSNDAKKLYLQIKK